MDAQRTPDELTAENESICEKLLGWERSGTGESWGTTYTQWTKAGTGFYHRGTPSFTTWADAGLILDALPRELEYVVGYCDIEKQWYCGQSVGADTYADTAPLAVRAAALAFVKGDL